MKAKKQRDSRDLADGDERRGSGKDEKKPKVTKGKKASGREGNWRRRTKRRERKEQIIWGD